MNNVLHAADRFSRPERLTNAAHDDLVQTLHLYGSRLSVDHSDALRDVLSTYSKFAYGEDLDSRSRYAFPLPTATGKTESIVSWAKAVHEFSLPFTMLICQEQVEHLSQLFTKLRNAGIPEDRIGLIHRQHDKAPVSAGSPGDYQFLLITHAMIRTSKEAELYMETACGPRSVCVYDESLIKSEGRTASAGQLEIASTLVKQILGGTFTDQSKITPVQHEAARWLSDALSEVIGRYHANNADAFELKNGLDAATANNYKTQLLQLPRLDGSSKVAISAFLAMASENLKVARLGQGSRDGIIGYELRIPRELQNVVVLDASAAVRELQAKDKSIVLIDKWENVKTFQLEVDQYLVQSGSGYLRDSMKVNSPILKDVVKDVTEGWLPADHAVVVIIAKGDDNAKRSKETPTEKLKRALEKAGVNLDEKVHVLEPPHDGLPAMIRLRPRFNFCTWGQERSTNKFRHCSHLIAVGVARRNIVELAGNIAGQREDLDHEDVTDKSDLHRQQASEQFYRLQQFLGRGTTRKTEHGVSAKAWSKVYDHGDFTPWIQKGIPGCTWTVHEQATHAKNVNAKRTQRRKSKARTDAAKAGIEYLESHAGKVSVSEITALPAVKAIRRGPSRTRVLKDIEAETGRKRAGAGRGTHFEPWFK